jgi:hypothetical protein
VGGWCVLYYTAAAVGAFLEAHLCWLADCVWLCVLLGLTCTCILRGTLQANGDWLASQVGLAAPLLTLLSVVVVSSAVVCIRDVE